MPLQVVCPSCSKQFSVPDTYAGRRGKCPKCENVFRLPASAEEDIPVGVPVENQAARPLEFAVPVVASAQPLPIAVNTFEAAPGKPTRARRAANPLVLAAVAGGIVLAAGVIAVAIWAAGGPTKPVAAVKKPAKKSRDVHLDITPAPSPANSSEPTLRPVVTPLNNPKPRDDLEALPAFEKAEKGASPAPIPVPPPASAERSLESLVRLREAYERIAMPANAGEFSEFQQLAEAVTLDDAAPKSDELLATVQATLDRFAETPWPAEAEILAVNKLAAESLRSSELGVFAYGILSDAAEVDGRTYLLFKLDGTAETLAIPVKIRATEAPRGSRWLVLGKRIPGSFLQTQPTAGDEKPYKATVLNSIYLVGEPKSE